MNNNNFKIGDLVIIYNAINDPVAEEYLNDHGTILEIHPPYVKLQFLNGEIHNVLLKNIKEHFN